jgi:hypothetical protein
MEPYGPGSFEITRPNIMAWTQDLMAGPYSKGAAAARDRVYELGKRIDLLTRREVLVDEEDLTVENDADLGAGDDSREEASEEWIENEETVCISLVKPL